MTSQSATPFTLTRPKPLWYVPRPKKAMSKRRITRNSSWLHGVETQHVLSPSPRYALVSFISFIYYTNDYLWILVLESTYERERQCQQGLDTIYTTPPTITKTAIFTSARHSNQTTEAGVTSQALGRLFFCYLSLVYCTNDYYRKKITATKWTCPTTIKTAATISLRGPTNQTSTSTCRVTTKTGVTTAVEAGL